MDNLKELLNLGPAQQLNNFFKENGREIRFVGGCVRDTLLGRPIHDIDFATNAKPEEMMSWKLMKNMTRLDIGLKHGTITFVLYCKKDTYIFEVTSLRKDVNCDGRHAEVQFIDDWREDARRRDFTINALYLDFEGHLYDYFEGLNDLQNKMLRFIEDPRKRIEEDYLRIYRYFRFKHQLGFNYCEGTLSIIKECKEGLKEISKERKWDEFVKGLMSDDPRGFVRKGVKYFLDDFLPEIKELGKCKENVLYHPEGNTLKHIYFCLWEIGLMQGSLQERIAVLFHDIGKLNEKEELASQGKYYGHEIQGPIIIREIQKRLQLPKSLLKLSKIVASNHMSFWLVKGMRPGKAYDLLQNISEGFTNNEYIEPFARCCLADKLGRKGLNKEEKSKIVKEYQDILRILLALYEHCIKYKFEDVKDGDKIEADKRRGALKQLRLNMLNQI